MGEHVNMASLDPSTQKQLFAFVASIAVLTFVALLASKEYPGVSRLLFGIGLGWGIKWVFDSIRKR